MKKTLRDIGEDALISRLVAIMPRAADPLAGPGDDCAVIDPGPSSATLQLLKTDALVESIHFLPSTPADQVGWKAIARVISDFAAMGGRPEYFLITLALSPECAVTWAEDLYRGMASCMKSFGGFLAGGETTSLPTGAAAVISIAATGVVEHNHLCLRSTASIGDLILVTGTLGGSIQGKHLNFTPRIRETQWLVGNHRPTAMMDLSDGLAKDLPRLAAASQCGFHLNRKSVPLTPGCTTEQGLSDGEDYEMLFTINPDNLGSLLAGWEKKFPETQLTVIGRMGEINESDHLTGGWDHFGRV